MGRVVAPMAVMVVLFMASCVAAQSPAPAPSSSSDCTTQITSLSPCLNYVITPTNETKPGSDCCTALSGVVSRNASCLCTLLDLKKSLGLPINMTRALALPGVCKVKTPPLSRCGTALSNSPKSSPAATPSISPVAAVSPVVAATPPPSTTPTPSAVVSPVKSPSMSPAPPLAKAPALSGAGGIPASSPDTDAAAPTSNPSIQAPTAVPSSPPSNETPPPNAATPSGSPPPPNAATPSGSPSPPSPAGGLTPKIAPAPAAGVSTSSVSTFTPSSTFITFAALALAAVQF